MPEKDVRRRVRDELQLTAVREVLRATAAALPLEEVLSVITNMSIIVFDATSAWIMLMQGGVLRTVVARGEGSDFLGNMTCTEDAGLCLAASGALPVIIHPAERRDVEPALLQVPGEDPIVLLPLRLGGEVLGLLGASVPAIAVQDLSFLVTMAEQANAAVTNARLRQETGVWRQRLDAVFGHIAEVVTVYDREGRLALMNAAAEQLLSPSGVQVGDTNATVIRKVGLTDARDRPLAERDLPAMRALNGERVDYAEMWLHADQETSRAFLCSAAPVVLAGEIMGAVAVWRDITHLKDVEHMRAQFLAMVSHELRTPLSSILGYAQLMRRDMDRGRAIREPEARVQSIMDQARRLNVLVEDLLEVSRAESGRLEIDRQPIDLTEILHKTVQDGAVAGQDHHFVLDAEEAPPVWGDPGRIEQVLRNLLSNATKYAPPGSEIQVSLTVEHGQAVVAVKDYGTGISREEMPFVFLPFRRVPRNIGDKKIEGVGLGLYIARAIIEAHGGEIWVESQLGVGSTFRFSLPLGMPESAVAAV